MIKMLMLFLLISISWADEEVCTPETMTEITQLSSSVADIGMKSSCTKKTAMDDDGFLGIAVGCLSGGGKAITGTIEGFIELVKLLVIDAPAWLYGEAKEKITGLINGDSSPFEMVSAIASINMRSQESLWDKAKSYWETFKNFARDLKNTLMSEIRDFPCLPAREQSQMICKGVSEVFLLVVGPDKFIKGAKWGIETTKALKAFAAETKKVQALKDASVAERLHLASRSLQEANGVGENVIKLKNTNLTESILPNGEKILFYEQKMVGKDGQIHVVKREVPLDAKTQAIDSNSVIGKEILKEMVEANAGSGSLLFIDINHLGKVNYFKNGTQGGDQYLTSVAEAIRKTLGPGDIIFKNGGDELVVVLAKNNPAEIKNISQRMMNAVDKSPEVRQIFRHEVGDLATKYREIHRARSLDDIPEVTRNSLSLDEIKLATENFERFKEMKKSTIMDQMQIQSTYRGSISVGSTIVREGESLAPVLARAEQQAARVKTEYKARMGHDVSKYNVEFTPTIGPLKGPPVALDPL